LEVMLDTTYQFTADNVQYIIWQRRKDLRSHLVGIRYESKVWELKDVGRDWVYKAYPIVIGEDVEAYWKLIILQARIIDQISIYRYGLAPALSNLLQCYF
jgi:hypothetical protein